MFIRFILQNIPQKSRFVPNTFFFVKIIFIMVSISTKHDNMHKNIYKKYIQKKPRKTPKNKYQKKQKDTLQMTAIKNENNKIQIPNVDKGYTMRAADTLLASLQEDLVLLNAGAGYGKTQILANYVSRFPGRSAWYNIDSTDNDLMSFVRNFTKSVQHTLGITDEDFNISLPLLENIDILTEQLVIWLDSRISFLNVILDDFQEVDNPDIFNLLDILVKTMDKKIRLFIVEKRSLPAFLQKYAESGQAFCIGTDDLKFTLPEIARMLEQVGERSAQWASLVYDCTEGWPVGIAQIMLQLRQQKKSVTFEDLQTICDNLEVSDYFMTRVYKTLPFDIQTFLKKTAVLDYMTPSICNKVAGIHNSESMLRYLVNEKLFVQTLGEVSSLYRYHSIFQHFLLAQTDASEQQDALRTASYFLLKTSDKIQAAEYACRAKAADIVQTVIEVSGDAMLDDRLYGTLTRWFTFIDAEHCELSAKGRFIYGKYLMALGRAKEAGVQIAKAKKDFYEAGQMPDYVKVLLFAAATKRKEGDLTEAESYLAEADADSAKSSGELAKAVCTEQIKLKCCLHQLKDAALLLSGYSQRGLVFLPNTFLYAAQKTFAADTLPALYDIPIVHIPEGFLLRNCILAEQMRAAFLAGDQTISEQAAMNIIQGSAYETLQTAAAWEVLAILSWDKGDYRKAVEQFRTGNTFLVKNHIWDLGFPPRQQQILNKINSVHRNASDTRYPATHEYHEAPKTQLAEALQAETVQIQAQALQKESGKIRIQCMDCFRVFLPGPGEQEVKWRTKKAQELFAYLFHLQGKGVSKDVLIELLWPDAGAKNAIALFHTTLYSIRQVFSQEGLEDLISYEKKAYALNMQLVDSDLTELADYLNDAKACGEEPERIIRLYPGSYMGNSGYLWSYGAAKELENKYFKVLQSGAVKRTSQRQPEAAIPFLQRIIEADPYNEDIASQLIACLYQSGRQSDAKHQYDRMQKLYREDLELDFTKSFKEIVNPHPAKEYL